MLELSMIKSNVLNDIKDSFGLKYRGPQDIYSMSVRVAMDAYLQFHGIIGYTSMILEVLDQLKAAEHAATSVKPQDLTPTHAVSIVRQAQIGSLPIDAPVAYFKELRKQVYNWTDTINACLSAAMRKEATPDEASDL